MNRTMSQAIKCGDWVEVNEGPNFGLVGSVVEIAISPTGSAAAKIRLQDDTMIEVLTKWLNKVGK